MGSELGVLPLLRPQLLPLHPQLSAERMQLWLLWSQLWTERTQLSAERMQLWTERIQLSAEHQQLRYRALRKAICPPQAETPTHAHFLPRPIAQIDRSTCPFLPDAWCLLPPFTLFALKKHQIDRSQSDPTKERSARRSDVPIRRPQDL